MAKSEKELSELKERINDVKDELITLSDEELEKISGGVPGVVPILHAIMQITGLKK